MHRRTMLASFFFPTVSVEVDGFLPYRDRPKRCFWFYFVFGGPRDGLGGPGGGVLLKSLSSGFATTFTTT